MPPQISRPRLGPVAAPARRRRAAAILAAVVVVVVGLVAGLVLVLLPARTTPPPSTPPPPESSGSSTTPADDDTSSAAQAELATRPMPTLPDAAAMPHALSAAPAAAPKRLPAGAERDEVVPRGFPPTPEGALAQLVALTDAGLVNADPAAYARAYGAVAEPGAPPVEATPLHRDLVEVRARAGLPAIGAVTELTFDWTPTSGLIKGTADRGRFAVVCALGQLDVGAGGRMFASGAGDCQALRYRAGQWWIAAGPAAAPAPLAWPGSDEAAEVGYRAVQDAR